MLSRVGTTTRTVSGLLAASALLLVMGGGVASATKALPHVDGMSWSAAQKVLKDDGFTANVASATGSREKWPDCEVVEVREAAQMTASMKDVTVSLNCDAKPTRH
jgi:beta-lactam-binding protein with PASTA domain